MLRRAYRLLLIAICWTAFSQKSHGCVEEYLTHNHYMISYVEKVADNDMFTTSINEFWSRYTKGQYDDFPSYDLTGLTDYIESIGDMEMIDYLGYLQQYLDICDEIRYNTWDYPTKEELAERDSTLNLLKLVSKNYKEAHLRAQYSLLYMRSNMVQGQWSENKAYWEETGSKLPKSVFRDMMENIYAGALFHLGEHERSTEIFALQGDEQSIRWSLRKYRNLAGIKAIYGRNANSHSLYYLIQDFVNNVQETIDDEEDEEKITWLDMRLIDKQEARAFCEFADSVLAWGETESPCVWGTAQSMLYYLIGDLEQARVSVDRAMNLEGNERVKDNCRCVRMLIYGSTPSFDRRWMLDELRWLEDKSEHETAGGYCYSNAYDRIISKALYPSLIQGRRRQLALAVLGMYSEFRVRHDSWHHRNPEHQERVTPPTWNSDYSTELMARYILELPAADCSDYFDYIRDSHGNPFDNYVCSHTYKNSDFFNDLIGTKYIAEARFSEALPFLEQVSLKYLSQMNVSYYMRHRDFTKERWFVRQGGKDDLEGINLVSFDRNPKVDFCRQILSLQQAYSKRVNSVKGDAIAYKLGTMYYQASYKGECWWLTAYGNSVSTNSPLNDWENDFVSSARVYLRASSNSTDEDIRRKSLYALAYIPTSPWADSEFDYDDDGDFITHYSNPDPMSEQYAQLDALNNYYEQHKNDAPPYISKCDVLRQFRKLKWLMEY